jgi:hypothetical protein
VRMGTTEDREPRGDVLAVARRVLEVSHMSTGELRAEVERLTGQPCRSWNKPYLQRKAAGLVQQAARPHDELQDALSPACAKGEPAPLIPRIRDRRLPSSGSEIVKLYKGHEIRVRVADQGFECFGQRFDTLTAIAKVITGQKFINGFLFFGLTRRKRTK